MKKDTKLEELTAWFKSVDPDGVKTPAELAELASVGFVKAIEERIKEAKEKEKLERVKALTIYNFYTKRALITLPLNDITAQIQYKTQHRDKKPHTLGTKKLTVAELLRMPSDSLAVLFKSLPDELKAKLSRIIDSCRELDEVDETRYKNFIRATKEAA